MESEAGRLRGHNGGMPRILLVRHAMPPRLREVRRPREPFGDRFGLVGDPVAFWSALCLPDVFETTA